MVDADGAIREAAESAGLDRSDFLKKGALAGGGLLVGSAMFSGILSSAEAAISTTRKSAGNDVKILNYALTLEFLEAAFYAQAVANQAYGTARRSSSSPRSSPSTSASTSTSSRARSAPRPSSRRRSTSATR